MHLVSRYRALGDEAQQSWGRKQELADLVDTWNRGTAVFYRQRTSLPTLRFIFRNRRM